MQNRSDEIVTAFAGSLHSQQIELAAQGEVRMVAPGATWKRITSLSRTFVCLDATAPASRRTLENLIAAGRVEYRPADWASL